MSHADPGSPSFPAADGRPPADAPYRQAGLAVATRVADLLGRMTLTEKLGQLEQAFRPYTDETVIDPLCVRIRAGELGSIISLGAGPHNRFQHAAAESRLGIPVLVGYDIIHGCRTIFPISLGLACAFAPDLFRRAQAMAAQEARADGVDWTFAPMCDMARDARWGRVSETCGEDPYLGGLCAAAQVEGFQGADIAAPDRVAACLKHFVGYSASIGGRDYCETEITEWSLRNLHLPPFHTGVKAGVATLMSAFNAIGGVPAVADRHTLDEILRGEWSFPGFVVSDWGAVGRQVEWGSAADGAEAARRAITAGNDMDMLSGQFLAHLPREVAEGRVPDAVVDEAVRRVLTVKFRLGLFERPFVPADAAAGIDQAANTALALECATRSLVLLSNCGVLPLAPSPGRIALIGPFADDAREMVGAWDNHNVGKGATTLATALRARYGADAVAVVKGCAVNIAPATRTLQDGSVVAIDPGAQADSELDLAGAVAAARAAAVVVMALGEPSGWSGESATRSRIGLTGRQQELFDAIATTGKPIIAVLFCGRPLAVPRILEHAAAVLVAWQPGKMGGPALAGIISGDTAPTGHLAISMPRDAGQCPVHYNRMRSGAPGSRHYKDLSADPQFWFGFGLTYTTFSYGAVEIAPGQPARASAVITNTGGRSGETLVQLYIRQLGCAVAARPEQELRGFLHIQLAPGEQRTVSFDLTDAVLSYVDLVGGWRTDPGTYRIWISPHAHCGEPAVYVHPAG